jgi:hypothetical protein
MKMQDNQQIVPISMNCFDINSPKGWLEARHWSAEGFPKDSTHFFADFDGLSQY